MNEAAEAERKRRVLEVQAKEKAEGKSSGFTGQESDSKEAWGRGTQIAEAKKVAAEYDAKRGDR